MQIYISKNGQQLGPFEEAKVLEMMKTGEVSPNDAAIQQGETQWSKLENLYPNHGNKANVIAPAVVVAAPKKSRKNLMFGCAGFFLIGILAASILGFMAYRNMLPADSKENLPDSFTTSVNGQFKLKNRYPPKGNIWGTEQNFVGIYENDTKKTVIYMMTVYNDEEAAKDALQKQLSETCQSGEKTMNFSFEADGKELSKGETCAAPLYVIKENKLVALGGSGADVDTWIEFAENLPFNKGAKMKRK